MKNAIRQTWMVPTTVLGVMGHQFGVLEIPFLWGIFPIVWLMASVSLLAKGKLKDILMYNWQLPGVVLVVYALNWVIQGWFSPVALLVAGIWAVYSFYNSLRRFK